MDFKKATDELIAGVNLEDLAAALGVSVQAVRQARSAPTSTAYRRPPDGWEKAVSMLAEKRMGRYRTLVKSLSMEKQRRNT